MLKSLWSAIETEFYNFKAAAEPRNELKWKWLQSAQGSTSTKSNSDEWGRFHAWLGFSSCPLWQMLRSCSRKLCRFFKLCVSNRWDTDWPDRWSGEGLSWTQLVWKENSNASEVYSVNGDAAVENCCFDIVSEKEIWRAIELRGLDKQVCRHKRSTHLKI